MYRLQIHFQFTATPINLMFTTSEPCIDMYNQIVSMRKKVAVDNAGSVQGTQPIKTFFEAYDDIGQKLLVDISLIIFVLVTDIAADFKAGVSIALMQEKEKHNLQLQLMTKPSLVR